MPTAPAGEARAAVAAVVRLHEGDGDLLLIRRAEHPEDPWSGHMAFPGGRVEEADGSPLAAAVRETSEEIGLDLVRDAELLGPLAPVPVIARGRRLPMVIEPFVFALAATPPGWRLNYEVEEVVWVPLRFFSSIRNRSTFWWQYHDMPLPLPCYRFEGRVIWGLTLRMIDDLVGAVLTARADGAAS